MDELDFPSMVAVKKQKGKKNKLRFIVAANPQVVLMLRED